MWTQRIGILLVMLQLAILPATLSVPFTYQSYNCPKSYTFTNARLHGGLQAGHFRRLGPPDDTELCVQRCCDQRSCDLVAWVGDHCYSVSCVNRAMCKPVRLPSYEKGMRLLYIASRKDVQDEVEPSQREVSDILRLTTNDDAGSKSATHIKRIIRSLEEIEDEDSSGLIKGSTADRETSADGNGIVFSGDYYERNTESMQFRTEERSGEDEGDWEGGLIGESGAEQDDDETDDIIQSQTHGVTAMKRTEMASVIDPREIQDVETFSKDRLAGSETNAELSSGESDDEEENGMGFSIVSGTSGAEVLLLDDVQGQSSSGSGYINKTIMREVQRNLHKVWRYASSGKNLDMVSKGPKGKEEERKLREIYNLVIKHESASTLDQGRRAPKEAVSGDASGFNDEYSDVLGESGDVSDERYETGSANDADKKYESGSATYVESKRDGRKKSEAQDVSGESSGHAEVLDFSGESVSGSGIVNKKLLKEVEHNLHKVWRYAAPKKDLDMVAKGPKGKDEEQKVKKIYNIVSKHESGSAFIDYELRKKEKSVNDSPQKQKHAGTKSGTDDVSGESSRHADVLDFSGESASGSGVPNKKLLKEVEHNLHKVWRYAAPKKDLDMVARGPKGKDEEQKVKKIYNIVSKHESGSAFIDFELRKKEKSVNDSEQKQKDNHRHKIRKSKVKITKTKHNATEAKLYRLQKASKYWYNKNLKRLKPWGLGMSKHNSARKNHGMYIKQIGGKRKTAKNNNNKLALLGQEMKELAPTSENDGKMKDKENRKGKLDKDETAERVGNGTSDLESETEHETHSEPNKSKDERVILDKQEPFDKTQFEIGRKLEEMILSRMAELEVHRVNKKLEDKQGQLKDNKEKEGEEDTKMEAQEVEPQLQEDKLVTELEKIKFLNGPSTVYNKSRFVYLKQCGLYVEEYNVSKTRASWNNDLFSPYSYLYEMPKNYHTCNSSLWMNGTDLRGDVFLSFRVMSIKGSTAINNANICEKYCCQEPRCQAWTLRLQQADTANCPKGSYCCWLKSAVPTPIHDSEHCTSGIVHRESTKHPPSGMRSAVPLGGLGTGSFELRADGTIHEWTIENQSPGGSAKLNKGALNLAVFGVRVADGDKSKAALLRIHAPHGYPGVESLSYSGSYPVSKLTPGGSITEDIDMSLYAFPSFHVREPHKSAVPAVAFTLSLRNKADKPLDVSFMFNLPLGQQEDTIRVGDNFGEVVFTRMIKPSDCAHACSKMPKCMSWTTNGPTSCLLKDKMPLHAWATGIVSGLKGEWTVEDSMLTCHRPGFFPQSGSTTLHAVDDKNSIGSFAVADDFGDIWKNFSKTGEIGVSKSLNKTGIYGAASVKTLIQPGEKKSLTIIFSWYYPHRDLAKVHVGNLYSALFKSSQDVAKHMRQDLLQTITNIQSWHQPIVGTEPVKKKPINEMVKDIPGTSENKVHELPVWLKDLLVNSMSFWRSGFWTEDGRWRQWEAFDCNDIDTIQNDMQRIIPYTLFFPDLVRDLLLSWADNQYSSGMLQEALTSGCLGPTGKLDYAGGRVMADTTAMFVVGLYHYYQWTGDQATVDRLWPAAKRAMAWVMVDSTKGTGLPFRKVSTYDIVALDKYDHDAYNTFVYLLSLRAAQELGTSMNDTKFVSNVRQSFSHAQKRVDLELWDNNKQFFHAWWDMEYGSPDWIMSDSLYGQVWAYSLGLGDLVPRNKLKSHLLSEIERNDSPFGLKVLNTGKVEVTPEDTSIILSRHIPGCKSLENITKHNSVWMGADADWATLMLHLDADPVLALNRAKKSLDHWRSELNDQWNIHGLIASNGYGLDGLPWATSHYSFHLVLWHIPLALSGQQYFARNASLTFWPKFPIPFNLPFFTPKALGTIQGAYVQGSDREQDVDEEEEMFTFTVDSGELSLNELAILGSKYGEGEITLKKGESVTWSRPKQDVKNILEQL